MEEGQREHARGVRIKIALGAMAALALVACVVGIAQQMMGQPAEVQSLAAVESLETYETPDGSQDADGPAQADPAGRFSDDPESQSQAQPQFSTQLQSESPLPSQSSSGPQAAQPDCSGTVVYRYVTDNATGADCTITETVTFGQSGLCETSSMEVRLADEGSAQVFAQAMQRDYGPGAVVSVDGTTVRAELAIGSNALDREAYEDALRASVRDLTIVKKS